jgi:hypothetical protein
VTNPKQALASGGPTPTDQEKEHERGYIEGRRRTIINMLSLLLNDLRGFQEPEDEPLIKLGRMITEREEALQILRRACAEHGDNDWKEDLHLADILDKHLVRHLVREAQR